MKYRILTSTTRFKKAKLLVFIILSLYKYNRSVLQCLQWPITSNGNCIKIRQLLMNGRINIYSCNHLITYCLRSDKFFIREDTLLFYTNFTFWNANTQKIYFRVQQVSKVQHGSMFPFHKSLNTSCASWSSNGSHVVFRFCHLWLETASIFDSSKLSWKNNLDKIFSGPFPTSSKK